jgi:hypothetical protein
VRVEVPSDDASGTTAGGWARRRRSNAGAFPPLRDSMCIRQLLGALPAGCYADVIPSEVITRTRMPKPELEFFDPDSLPWASESIRGLQSKVLARDPDSGSYTRLLKFEPGTDTSPMGVQRHDFWEEVWIVSGTLDDLELDRTFGAGMYACRPPGMDHGPWTSKDGCVTFEIRTVRGP